jgi:hypothetical protein
LTTRPPAGAALGSVTVPVADVPPATEFGLIVNVESVAAGGGGGAVPGLTVNVAETVDPPPVTEMCTTVCTVTASVGIWNVPTVEPAGTVTVVVRKIMNDGSSLVTVRVASAAGADATVTLPCTTEPNPDVTLGVIVYATGFGEGRTVRSACTDVPFQVAVTVT